MKINKNEIIARLFMFLVFFIPFVVGGASLMWIGYCQNNSVNLIFGLVLSCLGLFQVFQKYKISYVFVAIPILLVVAGIAGTLLFIFFYLPFFYKESLALDLEILTLKGWFVRFVIIIIDVLLLFNVLVNFNKWAKTIVSKVKNRKK
ncbi:hypothetical protein [Chryseobacterium sp. OSA05B]|uniref:hypothetical protein n=1 Tax=Chryseobacterium sp. OSA05B TaxID=2862650 RepID=UPI001CC123A5|nr:hypothetical protein [Chryseobacterium sp. OSA05B]